MAHTVGSGMNEGWTLKDHRDYAWEYFKVHAQQRMSLFNFFVVFSTLVIAGIASTFQGLLQAPWVGTGLGGLLMLISFVFWKLDQRVRFLIKHAESALKRIEATFPLENCRDLARELQLFLLEEAKTQNEKSRVVPWYAIWRRNLTYYKCFCIAYIVIGIVGATSMILSIFCEFY